MMKKDVENTEKRKHCSQIDTWWDFC